MRHCHTISRGPNDGQHTGDGGKSSGGPPWHDTAGGAEYKNASGGRQGSGWAPPWPACSVLCLDLLDPSWIQDSHSRPHTSPAPRDAHAGCTPLRQAPVRLVRPPQPPAYADRDRQGDAQLAIWFTFHDTNDTDEASSTYRILHRSRYFAIAPAPKLHHTQWPGAYAYTPVCNGQWHVRPVA